MKRIFSALILSVTVTATSAWAQPTGLAVQPELKERLKTEMNYIGSVYSNFYAPKLWKEQHLKWDVKAQLEKANKKIDAANTVQEYRSALVGFVSSTADYHVGFGFLSTESASLPLQVKTVQGKTLIVYIDRKKLSQETFPFSVGDQILAMDGVPAQQVLASLQSQFGANVPETDLALADLSFTRRSGRKNLTVPKDMVMLTILKNGASSPTEFQMAWEYTPELVNFLTENIFAAKSTNTKLSEPLALMASPIALDFQTAGNNYSIGIRESFVPDLGERLWESPKENTFDAYAFKNDNGKIIGVLRIPSYITEDYKKAVSDFAFILKKFNKITEGLVIDQNNNPGGSVFYLYALASMLTDKALYTPKHRMSLMPAIVKGAADSLDKLKNITNDEEAKKAMDQDYLSGYPSSYQLVVAMRNYSRFILDQAKMGQRLSSPYNVWGVDQINPSNEVQYSKPTIILVNELDFSGGDFFPGIMQDNKRVKVVGTRTAGAGGYVMSLDFPSAFGISGISMTGSIAERIDSNPLENLGVTPDIPLAITADDITSGYTHYRGEVKKIMQDLVK